jgi:hypothetical protein
MQDYNSYDLFVKNPRIHTNFPFLALDCNNKKNNSTAYAFSRNALA